VSSLIADLVNLTGGGAIATTKDCRRAWPVVLAGEARLRMTYYPGAVGE